MTQRCEIAVVGGGLNGQTTALALARALALAVTGPAGRPACTAVAAVRAVADELHLYADDQSVALRTALASLEDAPLGDAAAKDGRVRSHRFVGGHTWLAAMRADPEQLARTQQMLRQAATIRVAALRHQGIVLQPKRPNVISARE